MSKIHAIHTLATSNVDARYTSNAQIKDKIEAIRVANEKANSSSQGDPAYTVDISDEARALYNQRINHAEAGESASSSLFTQAGRTETAQRYNQIFESLFATYDEDEAIQRFDDFMRSEGYERKDAENASITAPSLKPTDDRNLSSHSYLNATVIDGQDHILAATWVTYAASSASGIHTYQKKVSDSFDLAADTRVMIMGRNPEVAHMYGQEYDTQLEDLWSRLDTSLEDALTTGSFIDSTVTEEEFIRASEAERDNLTAELVLTSVGKIANPTKGESSRKHAYVDDTGKGIMAKFAALKKSELDFTDNARKSFNFMF